MQSDNDARNASLAKDEYLVALKILLRDGDKLLITHDQFGQWDIPGGRIRKDQFGVPLEQILDEKIRVEIGDAIEYELGEVKAIIRVEREEIGRNGEKVRILGVCYEGKYLRGNVKLGEYHDKYEWVDIKKVNLADYRSPTGWVDKLGNYQRSVQNG